MFLLQTLDSLGSWGCNPSTPTTGGFPTRATCLPPSPPAEPAPGSSPGLREHRLPFPREGWRPIPIRLRFRRRPTTLKIKCHLSKILTFVKDKMDSASFFFRACFMPVSRGATQSIFAPGRDHDIHFFDNERQNPRRAKRFSLIKSRERRKRGRKKRTSRARNPKTGAVSCEKRSGPCRSKPLRLWQEPPGTAFQVTTRLRRPELRKKSLHPWRIVLILCSDSTVGRRWSAMRSGQVQSVICLLLSDFYLGEVSPCPRKTTSSRSVPCS